MHESCRECGEEYHVRRGLCEPCTIHFAHMEWLGTDPAEQEAMGDMRERLMSLELDPTDRYWETD